MPALTSDGDKDEQCSGEALDTILRNPNRSSRRSGLSSILALQCQPTGDSTARHMLDPTKTRPYLGANGIFHTKLAN